MVLMIISGVTTRFKKLAFWHAHEQHKFTAGESLSDRNVNNK